MYTVVIMIYSDHSVGSLTLEMSRDLHFLELGSLINWFLEIIINIYLLLVDIYCYCHELDLLRSIL